MSSRIGFVISRLSLALLGLAISILALEAGLRILDVRPLPVGMGALWRLDDELGWSFSPGMQGWVTKPDDGVEVWVTINSHGWRDAEYSYEREPDGQRILLLGDSISAGLEVELNQTSQAVLETALNQTLEQTPYEVINTGNTGYGTAQELMIYRRLGKQYQPDIVVLMFVDNDVLDNTDLDPRRLAPTFTRSEDGSLRWQSVAQAGENQIESLKTWLRQHTRLYPVAMSHLHRLFPADSPTPGGLQAENESASPQTPHERYPVLGLFQEPMPKGYDAAWQLEEELILAMRDEVQADGACFAVVITPFYFQDQRLWEIQRRNWGGELDKYQWNLDAPSQRLADYLASNDIRFLDLTPVFREQTNGQGEDLFLENDGHWNEAGHRVAGEAMYEWLIGEDLVGAQSCGL